MLKKIVIGSSVILILLAAILVLHIHAVTGKHKGANDNMQMALITFSAPLDSAEALALRSEVSGMPGVGHCYMNIPEGTMSYSYDRDAQSKEAVYEAVAARSAVSCELAVVSAEVAAGSCPVINKSSVTGRIGSWIAGWFN